MQIIHSIAELRRALPGLANITFVPTMGNLHAGHLALVRLAKSRGGVVVTSIFVNRLQFAPHEDFEQYPRTLTRDCELLRDAGCDFVFAPDEAELYPEAQSYRVHPPAEIAEILEGHFRPGFFVGVCTVVAKLFNMVRPHAAVFGKKDYQQLLVIRRMVRQLAFPIEIIGGDTVRESTGLALSSRNFYLSDGERAQATQMQAELQRIAMTVRTGQLDFTEEERRAMNTLRDGGWSPDYVAIRRRSDLGDPSTISPNDSSAHALVVVAAARLGKTRLIDNVEI